MNLRGSTLEPLNLSKDQVLLKNVLVFLITVYFCKMGIHAKHQWLEKVLGNHLDVKYS